MIPEIVAHGRLLEGDVGRLVGQFGLGRTGVFGVGAVRNAEHLITGSEPGHGVADGDHSPGDIEAEHRVLGFGESEAGEANQVRQSGHEVHHSPIETRGLDLDQDLVRLDGRSLDGSEFEHLGVAVSMLDDGSHGLRPRLRRRFRWLLFPACSRLLVQ